MDSMRPRPAPSKSKIAKTFQKVIHLKSASKNLSNPGFCLLIPQEKLKCCESQQFEKENLKQEAKESKNRAAVEAFIAKLFATISAVKAAYAELQISQFPYNNEAIQFADQAVVDELKALSELKQRFLKKQIDSSPPHVTLMLAEIQEQQSLMKTYEITMKKMRREIEKKDSQISSLHDQLKEIVYNNKSLETKLNANGSFSILNNIKFSDSNPKIFIMVLHYALRSIRDFVKLLIRNMDNANWDIDAAANAIQPKITFGRRDHKGFAFESFVCREIFSGFNEPFFSIQNDHHHPLPNESERRCIFFFKQFEKLRSVNVVQNIPNSLFGKFLKAKYLHLVHPKMEFSFTGNLNQRKMVNSGELYPETELFNSFAEMGRRVWLLHCLAFSFDQEVSIFQVRRNSRFSQVYMESIIDDVLVAADRDFRVAFTVVPGFKVGQTVVQSQVYLFPIATPPSS